MGFLSKINIMSKNQILLNYIGELKKDKQRLEEENTLLRDKLLTFIEKSSRIGSQSVKNNSSLTPIEQKVYNFICSNTNIKKKDICKEFKLSLVSVNIYLSRIRRKGYTIEYLKG